MRGYEGQDLSSHQVMTAGWLAAPPVGGNGGLASSTAYHPSSHPSRALPRRLVAGQRVWSLGLHALPRSLEGG